VRPFAHARDLLVRAKADGLKLALATSASGEELDHYRELLDAADLIDVTTSKDDVENSKPDPDIFQAALAKTGAAPDEALVIGDTPYDVIAAAKCGIRTIALLSGGFPEAELREAGAIAVYEGTADLLARYDQSPIRTAP
jgi:HAD superfamily hydrolase (TIGR01509 family)